MEGRPEDPAEAVLVVCTACAGCVGSVDAEVIGMVSVAEEQSATGSQRQGVYPSLLCEAVMARMLLHPASMCVLCSRFNKLVTSTCVFPRGARSGIYVQDEPPASSTQGCEGISPPGAIRGVLD